LAIELGSEVLFLQGGVAVGRILKYFLVVGGPIICILLFLLVLASNNSASSFFDQKLPWLLGLYALFALALLISVISLVVRLYKNFKQRQFGSRLMARLVLLFGVIGILPGTVIYLVSVQFVSHSIESWFNESVESALVTGLTLGKDTINSQLNDLLARGRSIALEISDLSDSAQATQLAKLHESNPLQEVSIVTASGRVIATAGGQIGSLMPDLPTPLMLKEARLARGYAKSGSARNNADPGAESNKENGSTSKGDLRLRVIVAIPASSDQLSVQHEARFLQLLQPVSTSLATKTEALADAVSQYHEDSLNRTGLRKIYLATLTLTLLLAVFSAIAAGFLIATNLAKPLLLLAEGTKAVAEGNLSPRPIVASSDELGTLTKSFNTMTKQLFDARAAVEQNRVALENAKTYLESVLANMSAGVMVMDSQFVLVSCNESVERILQHPFEACLGRPLDKIAELQDFSTAIKRAFAEQSAQTAADQTDQSHTHWQHQIEIPRIRGAEDADNNTILLARGSRLPIATGTGYLLVFDDISDVISAQRSIAWGEVARRLAHEIKNPLTPIQLSAERLQMKLSDKLSPADAAMLDKSTATIVNQVAAMKRMVDDFRDYAKTPPAVLSALDLNALVEEILHLYLGGDERDVIHASLASTLPHVMGDATQLRQVIHNLLQNAQDAVADQAAGHTARIDLVTEEIHYKGPNDEIRTAVRISIADNGPGFSPKILARAFEPYVTSKPRGTGLGLPMVKKIIDEHGGRIDIQNRIDSNGAKVSILLLKLAAFD
jgi:nitrogen fixation/metabolism regulation signal transduction histidine kinase